MARLADIPLPPDVIARASAGDPAAQEALYRAYASAVMGLICRLVRNRAAAEDLFQETMLAAFQALPGYRHEAPFGAWLRRIAVTRCLMHLRSPWQRSRSALLGEDGDETAARWLTSGDGGSTQLAELIDLERALARLPATAAAVLWLFEVEGHTHEEIARGFGRSISFSKSQLARAHVRLARLFAPGRPELPLHQPAHPQESPPLCSPLPENP